MRHGEGLRREPHSSTIPTPRFSRKLDAWNLRVVLEELVLKFVSSKRRGTLSRNCISENFQTQVICNVDDFQCWSVSFKTEVCVSTSTLELTMSCINEMEMAGSKDDFYEVAIN